MNPRFHRKSVIAAIALTAGMLALPALAQQPAPAQLLAATPPSAKADTGPAPTEAELQHFAHAASDVISIRLAAQHKLSATKDATARAELEKTAQEKMEAAVRTHHLSVQRYQQIAMVVETNKKVREQVMHLMTPPPPGSSS